MEKIYHYDAVTGVFLGIGEADECPMTGKPLIPAFAAIEPPPATNGVQTAIFERGVWRVVDLTDGPAEEQ